MENKKDIGKAISDKLGSLDKSPREEVWIGIREALEKKKKRRFLFILFWTRTIGLVLAGAIVAFLIYQQTVGFGTDLPKGSNSTTIANGNEEQSSDGNSNSKNSIGENSGITDSGNKTKKNIAPDTKNNSEDAMRSKNEAGYSGKKTIKKKNSGWITNNAAGGKGKKASGKKTGKNTADGVVSKAGKTKNKAAQYAKANSKKPGKKGKNTAKSELDAFAQNKTDADKTPGEIDLNALKGDGTATDKTIAETNKKKDSVPAKKEKKKTVAQKPEDKTKKDSTETTKGFAKFHVDVFVSPTHYGYFGNLSTLDRRLNSNAKSTEMEWNYGAGLSYQLTERTSIRIGYSRIKLNYTTKNALIDTPNYSRIEYKQDVSNESIFAATNGAETMDITQNLTYTEIPLEGRYRFLDKKIGLNAIFGFSFIILNENSVSVTTDNGFRYNIGKTKDIFDTSVSANIGLGIDYTIFKNAKAFIEPTLNYQAISFENSSYKPYYFGLHVGIRYALIDK